MGKYLLAGVLVLLYCLCALSQDTLRDDYINDEFIQGLQNLPAGEWRYAKADFVKLNYSKQVFVFRDIHLKKSPGDGYVFGICKTGPRKFTILIPRGAKLAMDEQGHREVWWGMDGIMYEKRD